MDTSPEELAGKVNDMHSFLRFVEVLLKERINDAKIEADTPSSPYGPTQAGWENTTLEDFLEGALAGAADSSVFSETENPWEAFALFLLAGKGYE